MLLLCAILWTVVNAQEDSCSAMSSYVQVLSPSALAGTLLSSQALFAPYSYSIPATQATALSPSDDICAGNITSDIAHKIVFITADDGDCSNVEKIYEAEARHAIAVLLVNDDTETRSVAPIVYDLGVSEPDVLSIPARMISHHDFIELSAATELVTIEFGCVDDTDIVTTICVEDKSGDFWFLDGEYQYQAGRLHNGHAVWKLSGYLWVSLDMYMFLHDGDGQTDWHWAITSDASLENDFYIDAVCNDSNIVSPVLCSVWLTTEYYTTRAQTFSANAELSVNGTFCAASTSYLCVRSNQSSLAGLFGSYQQYHPQTPIWVRDRDQTDCDTHPGLLYYSSYFGRFQLLDLMDEWVIAVCYAASGNNRSDTNFHPELCSNWETLLDDSFYEDSLVADETMRIEPGDCGANDDCSSDDDLSIPEQLCMLRASVLHTQLEGDYVQTGVVGDRYNTAEYVRSEPLVLFGTEVEVFLFFWGEVEDDSGIAWWVIADRTLGVTKQSNGTDAMILAYCAGEVRDPSRCSACWNFYYTADGYGNGAYHTDCSFEVRNTQCPQTNIPTISPSDWPPYVCIGGDKVSDAYNGLVDMSLVVGAYKRQYDANASVPHYYQAAADDETNEASYIWYSQEFGAWYLDASQAGMSLFCATEQVGHYLPSDCGLWYDAQGKLAATGNEFIYVEGCNGEGSFAVTSTSTTQVTSILEQQVADGSEKKGVGTTEIIIIGLSAVAFAGCIGALFWYCRCRRQNQRHLGFKKGDSGAHEIELEEDVDKLGLVLDGAMQRSDGGMDVSPVFSDGQAYTPKKGKFDTLSQGDDDDEEDAEDIEYDHDDDVHLR